MQKAVITILMLLVSNVFMMFAWYGNLKFKQITIFNSNWGLMGMIIISWGIAFFEYCLMIPANRIGFNENGGPFNLWQLKVIQEVITLTVFTIFTIVIFKGQFKINHLIGFCFLVLAVYFLFKK